MNKKMHKLIASMD